MNQHNSLDLAHLLKSNKIIVSVGPGGVGKTTTSIALALSAARLGLHVGLLSIDPARRLADALGISLGSELHRLRLQRPISGSIEAAMLDQKAVFDQMVQRFAPNQRIADKIFANSIYKEVSSNLGGPLEYMALAKLETMISSKKYDLIILDTPPDTHALDFLARPNILAGFVETGVMSWLIKPFHLAQKLGAGALFKAGGKVMQGISSITGVKMLKMLAEFLVMMEDVIVGFNRVGREVSIAFKQKTTGFVLVCAPTDNAARAVKFLSQELLQNEFRLAAIVINRNIPEELQLAIAHWQREAASDHVDVAAGFAIMARKIAYNHALVKQIANTARQSFGAHLPFLLIGEQSHMIHSEENLWAFVDKLEHGHSGELAY